MPCLRSGLVARPTERPDILQHRQAAFRKRDDVVIVDLAIVGQTFSVSAAPGAGMTKGSKCFPIAFLVRVAVGGADGAHTLVAFLAGGQNQEGVILGVALIRAP